MGSVCRSRATPYTPLPACRTHQGLKAPPWSWTAEGHTVRREASDPEAPHRYRFCIRGFCLKPVPRRSRNRTTPAPVRQEPRRAANGTSPGFQGPRSFPLRHPAHPPLPQWRIPPFQGRRGALHPEAEAAERLPATPRDARHHPRLPALARQSRRYPPSPLPAASPARRTPPPPAGRARRPLQPPASSGIRPRRRSTPTPQPASGPTGFAHRCRYGPPAPTPYGRLRLYGCPQAGQAASDARGA